MERITRRQDFVAAAKGIAQRTPGFLLQLRQRGDGAPARVGFTCTKKLGNAVTRNRIKRRLREAVRLSLVTKAQPACDYVLVGRSAALSRPFHLLQQDLISAAEKLHQPGPK